MCSRPCLFGDSSRGSSCGEHQWGHGKAIPPLFVCKWLRQRLRRGAGANRRGPLLRLHEEVLAEDPRTDVFVEMCGGPEALRKQVLCDFFREGFDGSGGDNFFEAGSCIDGRLTSAWNWCQRLEQKPFYPLFKLAGFASFDGKL